MDCVVNSPQPGEESYAQFMNEKNAILSSLAQRAEMVAEAFNNMPGFSCNTVQGAMYAFPRVSTIKFYVGKVTICRNESLLSLTLSTYIVRVGLGCFVYACHV